MAENEKQVMFSLRIVTVDSYMCEPISGLDTCRSEFRKSDIKSVPVIRIFGSTPSGQTACLHVHGVFPYLMIPYCGPDVMESHHSEIEQYMQQLASSLDNALNSLGGKSKSHRQHVFKIVLLRGIPFYGYHEEEELFLKIYFFLPGDIKRSAELFQAGMVLDRQFQPHEAHVPYILQLFLDYNLYGMNLLHAKNCWFRLPIGKPDPIKELPTIKRTDDLPSNEGKEQNAQEIAGKDGKFEIPTMSQMRNFNWNLLRQRAQSRYSQVHQEAEDDQTDSELPQTSSIKSIKENTNIDDTQSFSCSELCKSLQSRTLSPNGSGNSVSQECLCPLHTRWSGHNVPAGSKLPTEVGRHSTCDLEVDVLAADIANRDELANSSTTNPGITAIWEDERARRRERNEESQIAMDQSQPRIMDKNLSDREAHFIQMLYDALDKYKEENSMVSSFNDSLTFSFSQSTRRTSSETVPSRRESKDMFASSGETDSTKQGTENVEMSSPDTLTPTQSGFSVGKTGFTQGSRCSDDDVSTLELMRKLEEEDLDISIATQRGNGPFDDDNNVLSAEDVARSQMILKHQISLSLSHSQNIISPSSPISTQPVAPPSDNEDDNIENFEMSQRWDSAIVDLLKDLEESEKDDFIPQLDGASDETSKTETATVRRLGSTKRSCVPKSSDESLVSAESTTVSEPNLVENTTQPNTSTVAATSAITYMTSLPATNSQSSATQNDVPILTNVTSLPAVSTTTVACTASNAMTDENITTVASSVALTTVTSSSATTTMVSQDAISKVMQSGVENLPKATTKKVLNPKPPRKMLRGKDGKFLKTKKLTSTGVFIPPIHPVEETKNCKSEATAASCVKVQEVTSVKKPIDMVVNRVEGRTNVFTTILTENPVATLYDKSSTNEFKHSAVIDFNSLPNFNVPTTSTNIPGIDGVIKITSTPIVKDEDTAARKTRKLKNKVSEDLSKIEKPTRTRRPRQVSKNSYLEDPIYETVFDSDWDSDDSETYNATTTATAAKSARPRRSQPKKSSDAKRKRNRKPKVITKWIIVNRFKGISNMKIGLWKIPAMKRVKLTSEHLRIYDLYSPTKYNIKTPPIKPPPLPQKPRPMGKRTKTMLASKFPVGPKIFTEAEIQSSTSMGGESSLRNSSPHKETVFSVITEKDEGSIKTTISNCTLMQNSTTSSVLASVATSLPRIQDIQIQSEQLLKSKDAVSDEYSDKHSLVCDKLNSDEIVVEKEMDTGDSKKSGQPCDEVNMAEAVESGEHLKMTKASPDIITEENSTLQTTECSGSIEKATPTAQVIEPQTTEKPLSEIKKSPGIQENAKMNDLRPAEVEEVPTPAEIEPQEKVRIQLTDIGVAGAGKTIDGTETEPAVIRMEKTAIELKPVTTDSDSPRLETVSVEKADIPKPMVDMTPAVVNLGNPVLCATSVSLDSKMDMDLAISTNKTPPIKSKASTKKLDGKKKNVKSKKEPKRKKSACKFERNSPSPLDSDKEPHIPRSIVPVASRTVEPLCNRVSPTELEPTAELKIDKASDVGLISPDLNMNTFVLDKTSPTSKSTPGSKESSPQKSKVTRTPSPEKRSSITIIPSTKKVYTPSRKVTRNSVAVKLNSISAPFCMFTSKSDDSRDPSPPANALLSIVLPSPPIETPKSSLVPPRPWSPMLTQPQEDTDANDLLEEFAEATKILGLVDDSVFKNMGCIGQLISDHQTPHNDHKEQSEQMDSNSNAKEDNEKMLKHFDKIFENVSSNANASTTKEALHNKQSSLHLDEFEEETILEFIDEMTSPTQPVESQQHPTLIHPPTPVQDDSNSIPTPLVRDSTVTPSLPTLSNTLPQPRPMSTFPHIDHELRRNLHTPQNTSRVWSQPEPRPHSCHPGSSVRGPQHIDRPASAMEQWSGRKALPVLHSKNQMHEIRKNLPSPAMFTHKNQSWEQNTPTPQDYHFFGSRTGMSQSQPQIPPPYSQIPGQYAFHVDNQGYPDSGQLPRPNSGMDPPLQVFHTHFHHHHHVHSINDSQLNSPKTQSMTSQGTTHSEMSKVKNEMRIDQVKIENMQNITPWPTAATSNVTPEQTRPPKPPEKAKSKKTQFYVPNSPFPYPSQSTVAPIHVGPQGLLQTLTYVETSVSQSFVCGKSNIYALAGVTHSPQSGPTSSYIPPMGQSMSPDIMSIILKGSCDVGPPGLIPVLPTTPGLKKGTKSAPKSKSSKTKAKKNRMTWIPGSPLPTLPLDNQDTPSAKTPYGLMKQNSLNAIKKKKENPVKVAERKRKTISDFRAPPDTPTISLTRGVSGEKVDTEAFELSQDMFNQEQNLGGKQAIHPPLNINIDKNMYSEYNFGVSERGNLKLTLNKSPKTSKIRQKKIIIGCNKSLGQNKRPVPKKGEELILNFVTGEWEIVPAESVQKVTPVVFPPEEQKLLSHKKSPVRSRVAIEHTEINILTSQAVSNIDSSSSDGDFAVTKKRKKISKSCDSNVNKKASSTPEYMVSAVDLESNSPRLKLKLKKTPPLRGKPQLSTLVNASDMEGIIPQRFTPGRVLKKNQSTVVKDSETSDSDDDFALSTLKKRKVNKIHSEESDSDFRIEDISDVSTDDAPERTPVVEIPKTAIFDYQAHINSLKNMYLLSPRPKPISILVCLTESMALEAVSSLSESVSCKNSQAPTLKRKIKVPPGILQKSKNLDANPKSGVSVKSLEDGPSSPKSPRIDSNTKTVQKRIKETSIPRLLDDYTVIKMLLDECCDKIASTITENQEKIDQKLALIPTILLPTDTTQNTIKFGNQDNDAGAGSKKGQNGEEGGHSGYNSGGDKNGGRCKPDGDRSPSPHGQFKDLKPAFLYRTVLRPPTYSEVLSDLNSSGLPSTSHSKEPFYSDSSDVQTTSHRLSNLPPYIKKPKPLKSLRDIPEHQSDLPLEGSVHHWTVLAMASRNFNELENAVLQQKVEDIIPRNVEIWDNVDAATKLPRYPRLAKVFLTMDGKAKDAILRPAIPPPSRKTVENWLEGKKLTMSVKNAPEPKPMDNETSPNPIPSLSHPSPTPLRRSVSLTPTPTITPKLGRSRRVSFDLSNISGKDADTSLVAVDSAKFPKLEPIEGSPVKTPFKDTPKKPLDVIGSPGTPTTPWDSTGSFLTTPTTLPSIQGTVTPEGSSSAIKTLVGLSEKDDTSPLTFLISGSFTPPDYSTQKQGKSEESLSDLKKLPQSTPNASQTRQRKHALRKLAFTPIEKRGTQDNLMGSKSPEMSPKASRTVEQTPSKTKCLRKTILTKKFQPSQISKDPHCSPVSLPPKSDLTPSPIVLETPGIGKKKEGSQIDGPTLENTFGFKAAQQHLGDAKSLHEVQHITSVSLEIHVKTRIDLKPDPDMDEIRCLFYCVDSDSWIGEQHGMRTGAIVVDPDSVPKDSGSSSDIQKPSTSTAVQSDCQFQRELFKKSGITQSDVIYVNNEMELFLLFAQMIHKWDPDILVGYEVQMLSWGFLLQRAAHLRCDLCRAISRIPADDQRNRHDASRDEYGADNASELHIVGRIVLNLWRLMRTELALYDYSFESVAYHLLHERHPKYDHHTLTNWYDPPSRTGQSSHAQRWRVIDYYVTRVRGNMRLLQQQDFIGRTSELARLFGFQFYDVLTRGSQYRVESMLLRLARAHNLVAVTPSVLQRAQMRAPEVIALVMEPESKFYHVPVLVLDFQSLYPSMVIAYNICFSTCLGRVELLGSDAFFTFGCTSLQIPAKMLNKLLRKNLITINPSGVAFVKPKVRRGVMPQMLDEILTTRIMVKNSMKKLGPDEASTKRMLDHRQLGLKLIANVTYGYTAANFSGRMPCVEVGDSIVHKARETLERAINLVTRNSRKWENARVVYGDTDSMFIALEGPNQCGCTKDRAFEVGKEIAAAVTADNPTPVKLKFEKVYLPCVLQTKKRYVGYAFESEDQKEPIFDAKGIETVRRDGTPATAKILEKMLKVLFDTRDVSKVKEYVLKQCSKVLDGRTTLQDCIIAKEYRGKQYYKPGAVVPALNIARKLLAMDKRAEPRVGERVPYVIVHGAPGTPLYQLVRSPLEVLRDQTLKLNGAYYVTKQILPALDRVMSLLGVDVFLWHYQLPRTLHISHNADADSSQLATGKKSTISQFFKSKHCLMCKGLSIQSICDKCLSSDDSRRQATAVSLNIEARNLERRLNHIEKACMQCTGASQQAQIRCVSLDCPILYKFHRAIDESSKARSLRKALQNENMIF